MATSVTEPQQSQPQRPQAPQPSSHPTMPSSAAAENPLPSNPEQQTGASSQQQPFPATGATPLLDLEKALEAAVDTLSTLATKTRHFTYDSQHLLYSQTNEFVKNLQDINEKGSKVGDATIPIEVIEAVDKGRNPQLVTYQLLEGVAEADNQARGKLNAMMVLKEALEKEMEKEGIDRNMEEDVGGDVNKKEGMGSGMEVEKHGMNVERDANANTNATSAEVDGIGSLDATDLLNTALGNS